MPERWRSLPAARRYLITQFQFDLPNRRIRPSLPISTFDGNLTQAVAPASVSLPLEDEIDINRTNTLVPALQLPAHPQPRHDKLNQSAFGPSQANLLD